MLPRGLKTLLKRTAPAKLVGKGKRRGFADAQKRRYKGLTKALERAAWSTGTLPTAATHGGPTTRRCGWRGVGGGRRRGTAVDAQLSKAINRGRVVPTKGQFKLTKLALAALDKHDLHPVVCQRVVCDARTRIATAIDLLCYRAESAQLVVVELKCGYSGDRKAAAVATNGATCRMGAAPLSRTVDCTLHRHLAQLAATRELFVRENDTLRKARALGVAPEIDGALLYVDDDNTTLYSLPAWWAKRSDRLLRAL